jgi:hypothetical protein
MSIYDSVRDNRLTDIEQYQILSRILTVCSFARIFMSLKILVPPLLIAMHLLNIHLTFLLICYFNFARIISIIELTYPC